jgi:hypothetical protein
LTRSTINQRIGGETCPDHDGRPIPERTTWLGHGLGDLCLCEVGDGDIVLGASRADDPTVWLAGITCPECHEEFRLIQSAAYMIHLRGHAHGTHR